MSIARGDTMSSIYYSDYEIVRPYRIGLITLVDELVDAYYEQTLSIDDSGRSEKIRGQAST